MLCNGEQRQALLLIGKTTLGPIDPPHRVAARPLSSPVSSFAACTCLMTSALCRKYRVGIEVSEAKQQIRLHTLAGFNLGAKWRSYEKKIRGPGGHGSIARVG
jgi:hypothetical protein